MTAHGRIRGLLGAIVATAVLVATAPPSDAGAAAPPAPSDRFCSAFAEYFSASFAVQLVAAFGQIGGKKAAEEARDSVLLVLSPKLEHVTRDMGSSGDASVRELFSKQAGVFAVGVDLLRQAGVTRKQLGVLARVPLNTSNADLAKLTGKVHLKKAVLQASAKKFAKQGPKLDLARLPRRDQLAYARAGDSCGIFPETVDCATLVSAAEATAILGAPATPAGGRCAYKGRPAASGSRPQLAVDVYGSTRAFDRLTKTAKNQNVPGIGDDAVALDGFQSFEGIDTCGKSLVVKTGSGTVVVALCLARDVPVDALTGLARMVLARLP